MFIIANAGAVRLHDHARRHARCDRPLAARTCCKSPGWFLLGVNAALFVIGMFIETSRRHHRAGADPGAGGDALRHRPGAFRHHHGGEPGARDDHAALRRQPVRGLRGGEDLAGQDHPAPARLRAGDPRLPDGDHLRAAAVAVPARHGVRQGPPRAARSVSPSAGPSAGPSVGPSGGAGSGPSPVGPSPVGTFTGRTVAGRSVPVSLAVSLAVSLTTRASPWQVAARTRSPSGARAPACHPAWEPDQRTWRATAVD